MLGFPSAWISQAGVVEIVLRQSCFSGKCVVCWVTHTHPPLCTQVSPEKAWPLPTAQRAVGELQLTLREWQLCTGGSFSSLGVDGVPLRPGSPRNRPHDKELWTNSWFQRQCRKISYGIGEGRQAMGAVNKPVLSNRTALCRRAQTHLGTLRDLAEHASKWSDLRLEKPCV